MFDDKEEITESGAVSEFSIPDDSTGWALAEKAAWYLHEKKAEDVMILDLRGRSDVTDFFVLASGTSSVQVQALAKNTQDGLFNAGQKPKGIEGQSAGRWILLDYFDVIVHVFQKESREYFRLDKLWSDAKIVEIPAQWFAEAEVQKRHPDLEFNLAVRPEGVD